MVDQIRTPKGITLDRYLDMIRAGAHDAFLEVLRSGSDDPSAAGGLTNLLSAIRDGTEAATKALLRTGELRPAIPDSTSEPSASAAEERS